MMVGLLSEQLGSTHLPVEVLWQAVLGVTYQYSAGHIPEPLYTEYCSFLKVLMDYSDSRGFIFCICLHSDYFILLLLLLIMHANINVIIIYTRWCSDAVW